MDIPIIKTDRLILRPFRGQDAEELHRILAQEGVLRYFPTTDPPPLDRVQKLIAKQLEHWDKHGFGWWAVEPKSEGELIGWNGLQYLPETELALKLCRKWRRGQIRAINYSASSSFPLQHSMLDVRCSMFIFSVPPTQKQLSAYGLKPCTT